MFSDWRGATDDWSTNSPVTAYYSGKTCRYLRSHEINNIIDLLDKGDTLKVGIDYYAMFPISALYVPQEILRDFGKQLLAGKVFHFEIYKQGNAVAWRQR